MKKAAVLLMCFVSVSGVFNGVSAADSGGSSSPVQSCSTAAAVTGAPAGEQKQVPLVYDVENTGAGCTAPPLPALADLPAVEPLTDPFAWSDGRGRSTDFKDWQCRRNEIKQEIEMYEIGRKPAVDASQVTASFSDNTLTVQITANGESMNLTCPVELPAGSGPFPAVIGMNRGSGSLPSSLFSSRGIAMITFRHDQVTVYNRPGKTDPFFRLYPDQDPGNTGQYAAWAWGISRIIDGLQKTQETLPIDLERLAVTGCSYAGKMALFAGAYDERIALTIAQESGGGGAASWRVSMTLGKVETLCATSHVWFAEQLFAFCGYESKLPYDHHELMAMCAPRALLVFGNPDYGWLADESGYVSCRAAHEVYKTFGIADRFGFVIEGGHSHCAVSASQGDAAAAFVEKFLLGSSSANTDFTIHTYPNTDYLRWYQWWGSGEPGRPDAGDAK